MLDTLLQLQLRWTDLLDVLLVAGFLWAAFTWLRRTRSRMVVVGILLLSGVYLAAQQLELQLMVWLLQGFFAVLVIVLVVVFQEDLRRAFEQIAVWGLLRRSRTPGSGAVEVLVQTVWEMAESRTGALIVLPGHEPLERHLEGGIPLDGRLSGPLLHSIFEVYSPGHDGAVVVAGARVRLFAAHLPLSSTPRRIGGGTRHAAALGLSELTDALCLVVSEERGTVTAARGGEVRRLADRSELEAEVRGFLAGVSGAEPERRGRGLRPWLEALGAVLLSAALWTALVPGSSVVEDVRAAAVEVENLPEGYRLIAADPSEIEVTLSGPRRLFPTKPEDLRVRIDAVLVELGRRTYRITPAQVEHPGGLTVLDVAPDRVRLSVEGP